eukprot:TRINITY_DN4237_c0_g1_i7.p1 TRINITY_DN4237_c0_g1~~TRINITY_DN4237_c0_g1_i7.p1  ORF type:complete len:244 (-),score=55.52 TRINITY_DN4237_c0_g1_i7:60-791(-)
MALSGSAVEFKLFETAKKGPVNGHSPLSTDEVQTLREAIKCVESSPSFNINHQDEEGRSVAHWACSSGNEELVDLLFEFKADFSLPDDAGWTTLHLSSSTGQTLIVEKIVSAKACKLDAKTSAGATALHYASSKGFEEIVQILLKGGADPNIRDRAGSTALHRAASKGHVSVGKHLVAAKCELELADEEGYTPLHLSCMEGNLQITLVLIRAGASLSAVAKDGKTPLDHVPPPSSACTSEPSK